MREKLEMGIAWALPKQIVMWAYIRVGAAATTGAYSSTNVVDLSMMDALGRWPCRDNGGVPSA
jgi:hypothetical protein